MESLSRCTCGFEAPWGIVWAHCMNASEPGHSIVKEKPQEEKYFTVPGRMEMDTNENYFVNDGEIHVIVREGNA